MRRWVLHHPSHKELPSFVCWGIWKSRNLCIFENVLSQVQRTSIKVLGLYSEFHKVQVRSRVGRLGKSTKLKEYWVFLTGLLQLGNVAVEWSLKFLRSPYSYFGWAVGWLLIPVQSYWPCGGCYCLLTPRISTHCGYMGTQKSL